MHVVVFAPDLADRSRIAACVPGATFVKVATELSELAKGADVVVLDLSRPGVLALLPEVVGRAGRVVAFGPHVASSALEEATEAGAIALPRSRFFRDLAAFLG